MSAEQRSLSDGGARAFDIAGGVIGLVVFLVGIAMIIMVFGWVRGIFDGVDAQVQEVRAARTAAARAQMEAEEAAATSSDGDAEGDTAVVATPYEGPTVTEVGVTIGLKMLGLLVLGWLGALVAGRGAQLAAAHRGKRE